MQSLNSYKDVQDQLREILQQTSALGKSICANADTDQYISSNYRLLQDCYFGIHRLNSIRSSIRSIEDCAPYISKINKVICSLTNRFQDSISRAEENLQALAASLAPKDFQKICKELSSKLNSSEKSFMIYPKEQSVVLGCTMRCSRGFITVSNVYQQDQKTFVSLTSCKPIAGKYPLGVKVDSDQQIVQVVEQLVDNKIPNTINFLIESSVLQTHNTIKATTRDNVNVNKVAKIVASYLKPSLKTYWIKDGEILLQFNKLNDKQIYTISRFLKLEPNDMYKMVAMQGDI